MSSGLAEAVRHRPYDLIDKAIVGIKTFVERREELAVFCQGSDERGNRVHHASRNEHLRVEEIQPTMTLDVGRGVVVGRVGR